MSFWPALFIVIAIAMVVGPIMIIQPSRRDQRLAKYRQTAANLGLQVRTVKVGDRMAVIYSFPVTLSKNTPYWQLLKQAYDHDLHFHGKWQLQTKDTEIPTSCQDVLRLFLDELPDDILGVEVNPTSVGIIWLESAGVTTVEQVKNWLLVLYQLLV
jgi:hypothetical protein